MANYKCDDSLESARLLTRKLNIEDAAAWTDFFKDEEAVEFLPNPDFVSYEGRAKYWIDKQLKRYTDKQFGLQALIDKKTGQFVGQCGLLEQTVDDTTEVEVGYHIFKKYWGQAYAPEAAKLFIDYAFKNKLTDSVISIIALANIKSQRVADKNGLIREKLTRWAERDMYIYRINANA